MRILVVEDETVLRDGLTDLLVGAGHSVVTSADGETALEMGVDPGIDLILLDLMLPGIDGIEVCRRLRRIRPHVLILMLTARGSEEDKVVGLGVGADDYVTKPFGSRELLARIEALGRRSGTDAPQSEMIEFDDCRLNLSRCEATRGETTVNLTAREAGILQHLHDNRSRAVSRSEFLEAVWGAHGDLNTRTVDMTIANLRQKIERDPTSPRIVVTVKGVGYAWGRS